MHTGLFDFLSQAAISFLLLIGLLSFMGIRRPISVRASDFIGKPAADVFAIVDFIPGPQDWHRGEAVVRLVDEARRLYRITYTTISPGSADHVSEADFVIVRHEPPYRVTAERDGLGRRTTNQLLRIDATITDESGGCRLTLQYDWGPRTLLAHVLARMDIRSSVNRIKTYAETGAVDHAHETRIAIAVALLTGGLSIILFGFWLGWISAALLVVVLGVHEFGHLIAFRMIGQPWGRVLFIPFLGALAVPRLPFRGEREHVFAALMGPGFSVLLLIAAIVFTIAGVPYAGHLVFVTALINGLNLLPVLPLDGGHAARAILQSVAPRHIRVGMTICAIAIAAAGFITRQPILLAVALIAAFGAGSGDRRSGMPRSPMSLGASVVAVISLLLLGALYAAVLFWGVQIRPPAAA
jgi:Zn-dependent protease